MAQRFVQRILTIDGNRCHTVAARQCAEVDIGQAGADWPPPRGRPFGAVPSLTRPSTVDPSQVRSSASGWPVGLSLSARLRSRPRAADQRRRVLTKQKQRAAIFGPRQSQHNPRAHQDSHRLIAFHRSNLSAFAARLPARALTPQATMKMRASARQRHRDPAGRRMVIRTGSTFFGEAWPTSIPNKDWRIKCRLEPQGAQRFACRLAWLSPWRRASAVSRPTSLLKLLRWPLAVSSS